MLLLLLLHPLVLLELELELELLLDDELTEVGGVQLLAADSSDALDGEPPDVRWAPSRCCDDC